MAGRMPESDLESEDENVGPETALRSKTKYKVTVKEVKRPENCCAGLPQRYVMCLFVVVGLITCYLMRVCVNLALNEMTFKIVSNHTHSKKHEYCPAGPRSEKSYDRAEFNWDQHMQHDIIKSIYIGYIVAHVPAGVLADSLGGKHVFGAGILVSSVLSLCFPFLARLSPYAFMFGRVVQGFGQGVMFPSTSALVAKWAPPNERSTMTGIVQSGVMIGNAVGYIVSGIILDTFSGWEPIFYFCGIVGLIWCLGWYTLCYSSPAEHPFISEKEKEMILSQQAVNAKEKPKHIPWRSILTSLPFFVAILINFGHAWALFTMVNEMPTYMGKVLNFDVKNSGLFSALPHLAMIPLSVGSGYLCDWLIKNKYQTITNNRKVFSFLANTLPIPFMLGASYAGCDRTEVIILFMLMMFFKGLLYASVRANPIDLSPNFAGILMGIMNGTGAFAGLLSPFFVPIFITGDGSVEEWRRVFYLAACVMITLSIPYLFFASGEVQPWNDVVPPNSPENPRETTSTGNPRQPTSTENTSEPTYTATPSQRTSAGNPSQPTSTENPSQRTSTENSGQPISTENPSQHTSTENPSQHTSSENPIQPTSTENPISNSENTEDTNT